LAKGKLQSDYREGLWSAPDEMATEYETCDFLFGLVRLCKPRVVIETGCYHGYATAAIGAALKLNGHGRLATCDIDPSFVKLVTTEMNTMDVPVSVFGVTGLKLCQDTENVDLAFLDSSGDRAAEAAALHMAPNGFVVVHDAARRYKMPLEWTHIYFPTPRGLSLYSVASEYSKA
jgi:predicted O-methyltransferase YrrM